ncbi:MAG: glycosyltransferase family 39 protein [Armatimonadetes bacterium]|nr:glycosyltransferase family 39 protein [Armatimonadota bacterium]
MPATLIPLTTTNEGLYAQVAREMLETGDWVVPHFNSVVYFEKPPLLYWLVAVSMRLFGENAAAARLPSILGAAVVVATAFWLGGLMLGESARALAALVMATSLGFLLLAGQVMFDCLLAAGVAVSLAGFYAAWQLNRRSFSYLGYLGLAAATMTKGLAAPVLVVLVLVCWAALGRDVGRLRPLAAAGPVCVYLLLVVPWHLAISLRRPDFIWFYFYNEHIGRFLGTRQPKDYGAGHWFTPILGLVFITIPWAFVLPVGVYNAWRRRRDVQTGPSLEFLLCWLIAPLIFFTFSGNRQYAYSMPVAPAAALLVAAVWQAVRSDDPSARLQAAVRTSTGVFFLVTAVGWLACGLKLRAEGASAARAGVIFMSLWPLIVGLAHGFVLSPSRGTASLLKSTATGAAITWLLAVSLLRPIGVFQSEWSLARDVIAHNPAPGAVVAVEGRLEDYSSFVFYLPRSLRPIYVVEGRMGGDLQYGSTDPEVRHLFLSQAQFAELCTRRPVFYVTHNPPRLPLPPGMEKMSGTHKRTLWRCGGTLLRPP